MDIIEPLHLPVPMLGYDRWFFLVPFYVDEDFFNVISLFMLDQVVYGVVGLRESHLSGFVIFEQPQTEEWLTSRIRGIFECAFHCTMDYVNFCKNDGQFIEAEKINVND